MPYTICPNCGQKALRVATRCPRCGLAIEEQFLGRAITIRRPRRFPLVLWLGGAAALMLIVTNLVMHRMQVAVPDSALPPPPTAPKAATRAVAPATEPAGASPSAAAERAATVPSPGPAPSPVRPPNSPEPAIATKAPSRFANAVSAEAGSRRYASTWVNVRAGRRNSTSVLRILHPGEAVEVDSLVQGWYRVSSAGHAVGYADGHLLRAQPVPGQ